jgi:hypothetical protein
MKNFKTLFIILISSLLQFCSSTEMEKEKSDLIGEYELVEYNSNIPLDLNGDGIKNLNIFTELEGFYFERMRPVLKSDLTISDYYKIRLYANLPIATSNDPISGSGSFGNNSSYYDLVLSDNLKSVQKFEVIFDPNPQTFPLKIEQIIVEDNKYLTLKSKQLFFCYLDREWKNIESIAVFKKK